jgi:AcrR family transcriptional regulator
MEHDCIDFMSIPPKGRDVNTRPYHSERRQAQAARTRADIIEAAHRLFERHGYAATTMARIALEAEVAVETIYRGFSGKAALFREVVEAAVAGGVARAERPVEGRPAIKAVVEEEDPGRKLELYAATQPGIHSRAGPLLRTLREAAAVDTDLVALLQSIESQRLDGMSRFAQQLRDEGMLREDITLNEARDMLWMINSLPVYDLLVIERGWSETRYQWWITNSMTSSLLAGQDSPS